MNDVWSSGETPSVPPPPPPDRPRGATVQIMATSGLASRVRGDGGGRTWFLAALAAVCLSVGLLAGLAIATLTGQSVADARRETTEARHRAEEARQKAAELAVELQDAEDERDRAREAARKSAERAKKIEELETLHASNTETIVRSQALLRMVLDSDAVRDVMNRHDVRHKLKADWFWPETAYELIGGRWWLKEMVEKGLIEKRVLDEIEAQERREEEAAKKKKGRGDR